MDAGEWSDEVENGSEPNRSLLTRELYVSASDETGSPEVGEGSVAVRSVDSLAGSDSEGGIESLSSGCDELPGGRLELVAAAPESLDGSEPLAGSLSLAEVEAGGPDVLPVILLIDDGSETVNESSDVSALSGEDPPSDEVSLFRLVFDSWGNDVDDGSEEEGFELVDVNDSDRSLLSVDAEELPLLEDGSNPEVIELCGVAEVSVPLELSGGNGLLSARELPVELSDEFSDESEESSLDASLERLSG